MYIYCTISRYIDYCDRPKSWLCQTSSIWELWKPLCSWEPSVQQKWFCSLLQICASIQSCLWTLQAVLLTSWLDLHCQLWGLLYRGLCLSKSCPINWIYHRWTPIKVYKHLSNDQNKWEAPELNCKCCCKGSEYLCKCEISVFSL